VRVFLMFLFGAVFVVMAAVDIRAALGMRIGDSLPLFSANPWAVATLYDAYCGFLTFYVWVAYKERALWSKALWFLLVMGLGNIAMSAYALKELFKLKPGEPLWKMLEQRNT
jgi:Protein of unknown function (DUF1475)